MRGLVPQQQTVPQHHSRRPRAGVIATAALITIIGGGGTSRRHIDAAILSGLGATGDAVVWLDAHLTRYPIVPYLSGFALLDVEGNRISFHRTKSGALRARRLLINGDNDG